MTKFKVGDKVKHIRNGDIDTVESVPGMQEYDRYNFSDADEGIMLVNSWAIASDWRLLEKSWDTLEVGDIILDSGGDPRRIFGVVDEVVFLGTDEKIKSGTSRWEDIHTLQRDGWTIEQDSTDPETTELSVAELEEKLGLESGTLRVKKD